MAKKLFIAGAVALLLASLGGGMGAWFMFTPNTPGFTGTRSVKIPPGLSFQATLDTLQNNQILASRASFSWMASLTGWGDQIKAGHYTFEPGASNYDLLNVLRKGLQTPVRLTIPPGSRPEVVAAVAGRNMAFETADFLAALRDPALAEELGTDTAHLFGYMLPETYFFYWLNDAPTVIRRIKEQYDALYADALPSEEPALTPAEVANFAAIVEWETSVVEEKARIAGVYLNRVRRGWPLQADPTVQYALLEREGQKRRLFTRDYDIEHPYNTYRYKGLPPGPVTNPSPSSIRAVLNAETHNYMFFVAKPGGGHTFSTTLREHNRAAAQFHRYMRQQRATSQDS